MKGKLLTPIYSVCIKSNGFLFSHDFNPYIPAIPGMELFEGRTIHSKSFRYEEHFDGLRVAVLGVHYSGEDIAMHIANYAKKVLLSSITSF